MLLLCCPLIARPRASLLPRPSGRADSLARRGIGLKDPARPSSCFMPSTRGKYQNVGGSYADYLGVDLDKVAPLPGAGSQERRRGAEPRLTE